MKYGSVPFIFWLDCVSKAQIQKAYDLSMRGFLVKGSNLNEMMKSIKIIVDYWTISETPARKVH